MYRCVAGFKRCIRLFMFELSTLQIMKVLVLDDMK